MEHVIIQPVEERDFVNPGTRQGPKHPKFIRFWPVVLAVLVTVLSAFLYTRKGRPSIFSHTYANQVLGYQLTYTLPWRIASEFSEQYYLASRFIYLSNKSGCSLDSTALTAKANFYLCLQDKAQIEPSLSRYLGSTTSMFYYPGPEKSDLVVFTDLREEEYQSFLTELESSKKAFWDFPKGHSIQVYASEFEPTLTTRAPNEVSKIKREALLLPGGIPAELNDTRETSGASGKLTVDVPHNFSYMLINGKEARTLTFQTDAKIGSPADREFRALINSLHFR